MRPIAAAAVLAALAGCAHNVPARAHPSPQPGLLIEKRGVVMTPAQARENIAFVPIATPGTVLATAVIPPLGKTRNRSTNGLAIEYQHGGADLLLSQWPRSPISHSPCAPIVLSAPAGSSYLWTNRSGLVLTLQPDGAVSGSLLASEVRRLLTVSRCRKA